MGTTSLLVRPFFDQPGGIMREKNITIVTIIFIVFIATGFIHATLSVAGKTPEKFPPDLTVEKFWLDAQCQISFVLKNVGKGSIAASDHNQGTVEIVFGKERETFYFTRGSSRGKPAVDPAGKLKMPGGYVSYNTKIKLTTAMRVVLSVNPARKIPESNYDNNNPVQTLIPECPSKGTSGLTKKNGGGIPPKIQRGIHVELIPGKSSYNLSEALTVRYRFRDPDVTNPLDTTIYLHQQIYGQGQMWRWTPLWSIAAGRATVAAGAVSVPVVIPASMTQGESYVMTVYRSGAIWGDSNRFIIGAITDAGASGTGGRELEILSPLAGDIWRCGSERLVKWRTPFAINPSITLLKGSRIMLTDRSQGSRVVYDPGSKTYVYGLRIPRDFEPGSDYNVRIIDLKNASVHKLSGNFSITDEVLDLEVPDMRANASGHLIVTAVVHGSYTGPALFRVARITDQVVGEDYRTLETWEVPVSSIRTGANTVNLGAARATGRTNCGERYEVKIDSRDGIDEVHENNNTLVKEVYFRPDHGNIEIKRGEQILRHQDTIPLSRHREPTFSVWLKNCGMTPGRGTVEIRQTGRWEEIVSGGTLTARTRMVDHDILLGSRRFDLSPGATDYATMNEKDPESQISRIEIHLSGDLAGWAPANPMIIYVR